MTFQKNEPLLWVACERMGLAETFARANGVDKRNIRMISQPQNTRGLQNGLTIWVLGEIGCYLAEELDYCRRTRGAQIRYADLTDKVELE